MVRSTTGGVECADHAIAVLGVGAVADRAALDGVAGSPRALADVGTHRLDGSGALIKVHKQDGGCAGRQEVIVDAAAGAALADRAVAADAVVERDLMPAWIGQLNLEAAGRLVLQDEGQLLGPPHRRLERDDGCAGQRIKVGADLGHHVKAAYGDNYQRLSTVKKEYDPGNLFQVNQNIRPAA